MVAIFMAVMFLGFILIDLALQKVAAHRKVATLALAGTAGQASWKAPDWKLPEGVYVAGGHSWLQPKVNGEVALGADELLGYALGNASEVILPRVGVRVRKGDPLFHLALDGGVLTVESPVEGKVVSVNERLKELPTLVVEEPYKSGWVCSVLPVGSESSKSSALSGSRAIAWLDREFCRFSDFISGQATYDLALGTTSQDGGLAASGSLAHLDPGVLSAFENQFLSS